MEDRDRDRAPGSCACSLRMWRRALLRKPLCLAASSVGLAFLRRGLWPVLTRCRPRSGYSARLRWAWPPSTSRTRTPVGTSRSTTSSRPCSDPGSRHGQHVGGCAAHTPPQARAARPTPAAAVNRSLVGSSRTPAAFRDAAATRRFPVLGLGPRPLLRVSGGAGAASCAWHSGCARGPSSTPTCCSPGRGRGRLAVETRTRRLYGRKSPEAPVGLSWTFVLR